MRKSWQLAVGSWQKSAGRLLRYMSLSTSNSQLSTGFTLIETLAAVVLLTVSITAPMLLTVRSLSSAYYARDQFTAFYLAQEGIEAIHQIRDNQILAIAKNTGGVVDLFGAISAYTNSQPFRIDATTNTIKSCALDPGAVCRALQTNGDLYGYSDGNAALTTNTNFTRTITACYVQGDGTCGASASNEMRVSVAVKWKTASLAERTFTISENMYRWIEDGSGI